MPNSKNMLSDDMLDNVTGGAVAGITDPQAHQNYTCAKCSRTYDRSGVLDLSIVRRYGNHYCTDCIAAIDREKEGL